MIRVWGCLSVRVLQNLVESGQHPHLFYDAMRSKELAIQMMHDHIVNDILTIAGQYESLRFTSPGLWHDRIEAEIHRFLQVQRQHPPFLNFCRLYDVDAEGFLAEVLKNATQQLGGTQSN